MMTKRRMIDASAAAVIVACGVWSWLMLHAQASPVAPAPANSSPLPVPPEPMSLEGLALDGNQAAHVVVVEFADFQCPFCRQFSQVTLPILRSEYIAPGKILFGFHQLPLNIHPSAMLAAEAAECARHDGKFWEMHDLLFADRSTLSFDQMVSHGQQAGLNVARFEECLKTQETESAVRTLATKADAFGILGTPTFFIGRIRPDGRAVIVDALSGARSADSFRAIIDDLIRTSASR